jgi:hypothetical protein
LRLDLHDWQGKLLYEASKPGCRRRIAARAPNGAGKDDRIIAPLALWWLRRYRRGQVVITTADEKQLSNQTWSSLLAHRHLFGDFQTWRDHDHIIATPTGGRLSAWVTDEPKPAEGYHEKAPDGPLLMIINEAKSVDDGIFDAFNRCSIINRDLGIPFVNVRGENQNISLPNFRNPPKLQFPLRG